MGPSGSDRESVASVIILAGAIALADGAGAGESTRPDLCSGSTFKISARIFISVAGQRRKAERQLNLEGLCSLDNKPTVAGHSNVPIREHLFFLCDSDKNLSRSTHAVKGSTANIGKYFLAWPLCGIKNPCYRAVTFLRVLPPKAGVHPGP